VSPTEKIIQMFEALAIFAVFMGVLLFAVSKVRGRASEPAFAVGGLRKPRLQQQHLPAARREPLAPHLERCMAELAVHLVRQVVIARDQQHGHAKVREQQVDGAVGGRLVMHDVAGQGDGIHRKKVPLRVSDAGLQPGQRPGATDRTGRVGQQVRVRELNETGAAVRHSVRASSQIP